MVIMSLSLPVTTVKDSGYLLYLMDKEWGLEALLTKTFFDSHIRKGGSENCGGGRKVTLNIWLIM